MVEKVRIGILGTGRVAHDFAAGVREAKNIELIAVGSRSGEFANRFADEFDLPKQFSAYQELANDPEVDLVYIATPHAMHRENSLMCLDAGKAVICEKPFAINASEASSVIERAREKGLFLMEAMWSRYIPAIIKLRELLAENTLGNVQLMIAGGAYIPDFDSTFYLFRPELGGGVLLDSGIYLVSMASMIFGPPTKILAAGSIGESGVDEQETILLQHKNGAIATLYVSLKAKASPEFTLLGNRGRIFVHAPLFAPKKLTISTEGNMDETLELPFSGNGYQFEAMEAARCIDAGQTESDTMPLNETLSIMQTMDEIRRQLGVTYPMEA